MTPKQALATIASASYLDRPSGSEAADPLLATLRRDWAVRVLDAWAHPGSGRNVELASGAHRCAVYLHNWSGDCEQKLSGATFDIARHDAALAVFPTLPDDVRMAL